MTKKDETNNMQESLDHIVKNMVTKKELDGLVKLDAFNEMREELNYVVKNMVTRDDVIEIIRDEVGDDISTMKDNISTMQGSLVQNTLDIQNLQSNVKEIKSIVNNAFINLDQTVKKTETETMERTALHHKVDRHDGWIHDIAREADMALA